jgi:WhiB family transcriptional regulator, redox-sensing transcriptional regulator
MTSLLDRPSLGANGDDADHTDADDWRHHSACRDRDRALFFPPPIYQNSEDEPVLPSPEAQAICNRCPVRVRCLEYALVNRIEFGIFAGLSGYQRKLMLKPLSRRRCPGCGSDEIETIGRNQICGSCGISWDRLPPSAEEDDE